MNAYPVVVEGTLKPDGTLELDQRPDLPAGRVRVTVQPLAEASPVAEDWWQCLQRSRAELEAAGHRFRTEEEIEAEREDFRSGDERVEEIRRHDDSGR
jgi:hypothetical protein